MGGERAPHHLCVFFQPQNKGGGGGTTECQAAILRSQKQVTVVCGQVAPPLLCPGGPRAPSAPPHPEQAALGQEASQTLAESWGRGTDRSEAHPALPSVASLALGVLSCHPFQTKPWPSRD